MSIGLKKAKELDADILLGTDPDADRVGIAIKDHKGEWVLMNGNQTAVLAFNYMIEARREKKLAKENDMVIKTIVTTDLIDVIAKAITKLSNGEPIGEIGIPDTNYIEKNALRPLLGENWIEGQIIFIDNFENVIVNITQEQFEEQRKGRRFKIVFKRDEIIERISGSYADVPQGEKLVLFKTIFEKK